MGFSCCCYDRDIDRRLSPAQVVLYGMQKSIKTVVVLSPEFVESSWSNLKVRSENVNMHWFEDHYEMIDFMVIFYDIQYCVRVKSVGFDQWLCLLILTITYKQC